MTIQQALFGCYGGVPQLDVQLWHGTGWSTNFNVSTTPLTLSDGTDTLEFVLQPNRLYNVVYFLRVATDGQSAVHHLTVEASVAPDGAILQTSCQSPSADSTNPQTSNTSQHNSLILTELDDSPSAAQSRLQTSAANPAAATSMSGGLMYKTGANQITIRFKMHRSTGSYPVGVRGGSYIYVREVPS